MLVRIRWFGVEGKKAEISSPSLKVVNFRACGVASRARMVRTNSRQGT